jgi:hypothetical protein
MALRGWAKERLHRFGEEMVLLRSLIGIISCATGSIGVWVFYPNVSEKHADISARLDVGLQPVSVADRTFCPAVNKARAEFADFGQVSSGTHQGSSQWSRRD